jgi:hypothetical protein
LTALLWGFFPPPAAWSQEQQTQQPQQPVGQAPDPKPAGEAVAGLDDRGVLTPKGKLIVEPAFRYIHSTDSQVSIDGFTILPSLILGLIDVSELQRDTFRTSVSFRYGLTSRLEVEATVPWVYREETVKQRAILEGSSFDVVSDSDGSGLGDLEAAVHYQFNSGAGGGPVVIGNFQVKARNARDPFDVDRKLLFDENGNLVGQQLEEQPIGSGFWAFKPSLTIIYPSDPMVLYGNVSYLWNKERKINDQIGKIDPGDAVGFGFGMGFSVNERTSFSLGYDHTTVFKNSVENDEGLDPVFDRFQVGSFALGLSHRLNKRSSLNLGISMGVTSEAPDVDISLRLPISFFE